MLQEMILVPVISRLQNASRPSIEQDECYNPNSAFNSPEFVDMLPTTTLGKYYKCSVTRSEQTGVIFFSEQMQEFLNEVTNIQFDGTFFTVPYSNFCILIYHFMFLPYLYSLKPSLIFIHYKNIQNITLN